MLKEVICLICCRGGSKGIKNKNIKIFNKKPLLSWTLEAAIKSKVFNRIILSTDSKKIATVGKRFNIEIPGLRPKQLSLSSSNQFDTHKYIFDKLNINDSNSIVCVLNNNPFINKNYIIKSFKIFQKNKFKNLVTDCIKVNGDYVFLKQCKKKFNKIHYIFKKKFLKLKLNRQELKSYYVNIFNIRWGLVEYLRDYNSYKYQLIKGNNGNVELNKIHNFDIDDDQDWFIAETIFKKVCEKKLF